MLDVKLSKIQHPKFVSIFCILVWKFKFWETRKFDETINSVKNHICVSRFYHVRVWVCVYVCVLFTMGVDFLGLTYAPTSAGYGRGTRSAGGGMLKIFRVSETPPSPDPPPLHDANPGHQSNHPVRQTREYIWMGVSHDSSVSHWIPPNKHTEDGIKGGKHNNIIY